MIPYVFDGKPFWRIGSSTRRMPQQAYQQMLMDRTDALQFWNAETTTPLAIEDLDQAQILYTLDESIKRGRTKAALATKDPKTALQTLGLLKNGLITHAAGMLFCRDAETHFPQSLLRLVLFKGLTKSEILDSRRIYDNAFALLAETEDFLMRHMSISSEFIPGKMARKDHPEYSLRAVREAMVNAICHRDYRIKGGSISLMMYDNRLEITSHGTLPRGITVDDLKQVHESFPRNAKITHVMYKCGVIESVGSGTQEMIQECQAIGAPEPEYIEKGTTFMVRFYKNKQDQQPEVLTPRQQEILNIMASRNDCTTTQIRQTIKEPPTDRTLRSDLAQLEALGYVLRHGEGSGTRWRVT
jgi:ATP-dependent DNA helicase RecG